MKRFIGVILLSALASVAQQPAPKTPTTPSGRYQLVAVELDAPIGSGSTVEHAMFLVDTQTGRVWKFQIGGAVSVASGAQQGYLPETFLPVNFGQVQPIPMGGELPVPAVYPR